MQSLNRRDWLTRAGAGALWLAGQWPGRLRAEDSNRSGKARFIVVNDTHYIDEECGRWLNRAVDLMKKEEPDFILHAGDLTEHGKREHLAAMRELLRSSGKPFYVVPGNHDYLTQSSAADYDALYERQRNYSFESNGWQFVALDTTEGKLYEKTSVQPETMQWLRDALPKLDKKLPTVVCTHFPLGVEVRYRPKNADEVLEQFKPFNLQAIFCGHFHGFTERKFGAAPIYTNRCCSLKRGNHDRTSEKGFFICTAAEGKVSTRFIEVAANKRLSG
ncbi:MAG: metallophosphoesterase [Verrucomicrobiota bacterium]